MDEVVAYQQTVNGVTSRYYPHYNHLYSVAALTDAAGVVVERFAYDAYGKQTITSATGTVRAKSAVGFDRGFTGYVVDRETGLLHAENRQYSPPLGRFSSRDPLKYVDGLGLYLAYFVPSKLDPTGLITYEIVVRASYGHTSPEFSAPHCVCATPPLTTWSIVAGSANPQTNVYDQGVYLLKGSDGNAYRAVCTRLPAGKAATQAHENAHKADAIAAVAAANAAASLPKGFATKAACLADLALILPAWNASVGAAWGHSAAHDPPTPQPTPQTFNEENAAGSCTFTLLGAAPQ